MPKRIRNWSAKFATAVTRWVITLTVISTANAVGGYTNARYLREIRRAQRVLMEMAGVQTRLFRPPRGEVNGSNLLAMLASRHKIIYWSIEAGEWGRRKSESGEALAEYVVQHIQPRDVLLLHDNNPKTLTC